jgi:succinate dehydrogenase / fumarate reductase flavoprotein subunit
VDYELMTTIPGLFGLGEANFADHGANRLGANSLLQASVDGYFIAPYSIANYLAGELKAEKITTEHPAFVDAEHTVKEQLQHLLNINGQLSADHFHKTLGKLLYEGCGLSRTKASLMNAITLIKELRIQFNKDLKVTGDHTVNSELEKAGRVADYLDLGILMCEDALSREESCGAHFREEYQTPEGDAQRNDQDYCYVSAWEWKGDDALHELHKEPLVFENVDLTVRSYK